jgi:2-haloacid dehalogenase
VSAHAHPELEPRVQSEDPRAAYREVMAAVLAELASEAGRELAPEDEDALGCSLPAWPVFPEVSGQLEEARRRGWQRHVHVAQSHFHDIVPASEWGIRSVWINRLGERAQPTPTRELPDLHGLADVLDDLVP